ncbi:YheV family putative zinc ribbon protein [Marinobacteraceae bacterium S3BR75-40.1]
MQTTKRFIAGAVCPRCSAMDRIVTFSDDEGSYRECVACDFFEKLPEEQPDSAPQPQTRVTRPLEKDPNVQQVVIFRSSED